MSELATVLQELRLIKSQQAAIIRMLKPEVKPHLVKVGAVVKATGWNREMLRKARELKWVEWDKRNGHFYYDLNSIDKKFLINK